MPPCQDLPHHGHHDLKRDLSVQSNVKRGFLDGEPMNESKCLDWNSELQDSEEVLEKFKMAWERFL